MAYIGHQTLRAIKSIKVNSSATIELKACRTFFLGANTSSNVTLFECAYNASVEHYKLQ